MKRVFCAVLVFALVLSMTGMAFAAGGTTMSPTGKEIDIVEVLGENGERIKGYIRITTSSEAEKAMKKLEGEIPEAGEACENGWSYAENQALVGLYKLAAESDTTTAFMEKHDKDGAQKTAEKACETLTGVDSNNLDNFLSAVIFDVKVDVQGLCEELGVAPGDLGKVRVRLSSDSILEDSGVFFQREVVSDYSTLIDGDKVNVDDVVFTAGEGVSEGSVILEFDLQSANGPYVMYVEKQA